MCLNIFCFIDLERDTFVLIWWILYTDIYVTTATERFPWCLSLTFSFSLAIEYSLHACVILSFFISFLRVHYLFIVYATMIWNQWMFLCSKDRPLHVWSKILQHVNDFVSPDSFISFSWVLIHTLKIFGQGFSGTVKKVGALLFQYFLLVSDEKLLLHFQMWMFKILSFLYFSC